MSESIRAIACRAAQSSNHGHAPEWPYAAIKPLCRAEDRMGCGRGHSGLLSLLRPSLGHDVLPGSSWRHDGHHLEAADDQYLAAATTLKSHQLRGEAALLQTRALYCSGGAEMAIVWMCDASLPCPPVRQIAPSLLYRGRKEKISNFFGIR